MTTKDLAPIEIILLAEEGLRLGPYRCSAGKWTAGIGRNFEDRPFTLQECEDLGLPPVAETPTAESLAAWLTEHPLTVYSALWLLRGDIATTQAECSRRIGLYSRLDPVRRDVLASMAYQMGVGREPKRGKPGMGLLGFPALLAALALQDWPRAADEALNSAWARQTPARARRHATMLRSGQYHYWHGEVAARELREAQAERSAA